MSRSGSRQVKALLRHCRALKSSEQPKSKSWSTFVVEQCKASNSSADENVRASYRQQTNDVVAYLDELGELEVRFHPNIISTDPRSCLGLRVALLSHMHIYIFTHTPNSVSLHNLREKK